MLASVANFSAMQWYAAAFVFVLGACVGSFLNVVVYRLPRLDLSGVPAWRQPGAYLRHLSVPPSHCPACEHRLSWRDNLPIIGWPLLGGKCRYCKVPYSVRYPLVELLVAGLFLAAYVLLFGVGLGPGHVEQIPATIVSAATTESHTLADVDLSTGWPVLLMVLWLLAALVAATLIDAEHYIIPLSLPYTTAVVALLVHLFTSADVPGIHAASPAATLGALGAVAGLGVSVVLLAAGVFKVSFAEGEGPMLERDVVAMRERGEEVEEVYTPSRVRSEMRKEMTFLLPPLLLFAAGVVAGAQLDPTLPGWLARLGGSLIGGLAGGFVVWLTRIAGSYGFGKEAMGLGDVHLMVGVGCVLGPVCAVAAFFLAPFAGLPLAGAVWAMTGRKQLPYGPYLAVASVAALLLCPRIEAYLLPGLEGLRLVVTGAATGG